MTEAALNDDHCLLFVYGSLQRGHSNHRELGSARFLTETRTAPRFALRVISGYPLLVPGVRSVRGELFEVPPARLAFLDAFEGSLYVRTEIELENGGRALGYLARDEAAGVAYEADHWLDLSLIRC